jgi:uncharacterized protein (TIGR03067 family)
MMLIAATVWGIAAPKPKEAVKKDAETPTIVGSWKLEKMTMAGKELPAKELVFEFTRDGKMLAHDPGRPERELGTYKLDQANRPAEIDWFLDSKNEQTLRGIFRINGDTLTICIDDGLDSVRPARFESPAGTRRMLWTLSRTSKKN